MNALEITNLTKTFPGFTLDNLTLTLPSGCIMGLIGENGAGKSTAIKLILDILHKDSGSVTILGRDNRDNIRLTKEDIGVVMDEVGIPECLTARQVGRIMQYTYRQWDAAEYQRLLHKLALPDNKPFKDFSRGMKMKLGIAIAMSHGSKLLLLDEPTSGLDPVVRDEVVGMFHDFTRDESHSILDFLPHRQRSGKAVRLCGLPASRKAAFVRGKGRVAFRVRHRPLHGGAAGGAGSGGHPQQEGIPLRHRADREAQRRTRRLARQPCHDRGIVCLYG